MFSKRQQDLKANPSAQRNVVCAQVLHVIFVQRMAGPFSREFRRCATNATYLHIVNATETQCVLHGLFSLNSVVAKKN